LLGAKDTRRFEMVGAFGDDAEPPPLPQAAARRARLRGNRRGIASARYWVSAHAGIKPSNPSQK
jgi:hypothetical protein